jgi:hypothetical protein
MNPAAGKRPMRKTGKVRVEASTSTELDITDIQ